MLKKIRKLMKKKNSRGMEQPDITMEELKNLEKNQGYVKTMWCGSRECEDKVKEVTGAPSRCMPFEQEHLADTCAICGKKATKMIVWGRQY